MAKMFNKKFQLSTSKKNEILKTELKNVDEYFFRDQKANLKY